MRYFRMCLSAVLLAVPGIPNAGAVQYSYYEYHAPETLNDISGSGPESIWAVGDNGLILHCDGSEWRGEESGTAEKLVSVSAVDASHAYAVGPHVCLYRDEDGWRAVTEVPGGSAVRTLPSGEAWVVCEGALHHYDGREWGVETLPIEGELKGVGVAAADDLWLASYSAYPNNPLHLYHLVGGEIVSHQEDSWDFLYSIKWADVFARDSRTAWAAIGWHLGGSSTGNAIWNNSVWQFDEGIWNFISGWPWDLLVTKIRAGSTGPAYAVGRYKVSRLDGSSLVTVAPLIEPGSGIFPAGDNEWWSTEGTDIRHFAEWPLSQSPIGTKIVIKRLAGGEYKDYYDPKWDIVACIQPTSASFDLYLLMKMPGGKVYSILPREKMKRGIRPYLRHIRGIGSTQTRIVKRFRPSDWPEPATYEVGIFLMPAGRAFSAEKALGSYIYSHYVSFWDDTCCP